MPEKMHFPNFEKETAYGGKKIESGNYVERGPHKNTEIKMHVSRHGKKTKEGGLSPEGYEQARIKGSKRKVIGTGIKGIHGPKPRTAEMVKTTIAAIPETVTPKDFKVYASRMRMALDHDPMSKEFIAEWGKKGNDAAQWYISEYYDKQFDQNTISAKDLSNRAANLFYRHIRMAERLKDGSKINLEYASHTPTLDIFVANAFKDQIEKDPINPEGKNIFEKMGGTFKEADEFEIDAKTDPTGMLSANFSFRGKEYKVDLDKLKTMSEAWLEKQKTQEV